MYELGVLISEIAFFIFLHYKTKFVDEYPNGWRQITLYAIGVLFTLPFFVLFDRKMKSGFYSYVAGFMGAGVGTAFGYMSTDLMRYVEK